MQLQFISFVVFDYDQSSGAEFKAGDLPIRVPVSPDAQAAMRAILFAEYERNREALASAILSAQPLALPAPDSLGDGSDYGITPVQDAEYEDVPF